MCVRSRTRGERSDLATFEQEVHGREQLAGNTEFMEALGLQRIERVVERFEIDDDYTTEFAVLRAWSHQCIHVRRAGNEPRALRKGSGDLLHVFIDFHRVCGSRVHRERSVHVPNLPRQDTHVHVRSARVCR